MVKPADGAANLQLPTVLAYLDQPLLPDSQERLPIAGFADLPAADKNGVRWFTTILVPFEEVDTVLDLQGGLQITEHSPLPSPDFPAVAAIAGPNDALYEVLVQNWVSTNIRVFDVATSFLAAFTLVPRMYSGAIEWDDLDLPEHGVVTIIPTSVGDGDSHTAADVRIKMRYAENYAAGRECALVTLYWDERFFYSNSAIEQLLGEEDAVDLHFPGKTIYLRRMTYTEGNPILVQAAGVKLLLHPKTTHIANDREFALSWPDVPFPVSRRTMHDLEMLHTVYARDEFLQKFENRDAFSIHPIAGSVSYEGRWAISYAHRIGRDYVECETRKLYGGCPEEVVRHFHAHAVPEQVVLQQMGQTNIGKRAERYVTSFLDLAEALSLVGQRFGVMTPVATISRSETDYHGWWNLNPFRGLGYTAARSMTLKAFLDRCLSLRIVLELLKEHALREILTASKFPQKELPKRGSFLLIGALARMASLAERTGLRPEEPEFFERLHEVRKVDSLRPILALNDFRLAAAHLQSSEDETFRRACETFGIDPAAQAAGWGLALDSVYDRVTSSFSDLTRCMHVLARIPAPD